MKVSEMAEYRDDKLTKTGLRVKDRIIHIPTGQEYIVAYLGNSLYGAINLKTGHPWSNPIENINSFFAGNGITKATLEEMLGNLDNWEVKE